MKMFKALKRSTLLYTRITVKTYTATLSIEQEDND